MPKNKLTAEEKDILEAYEAGRLKPVKNAQSEKDRFQEVAKYTLQKSKSINIRLPERDVQHLKAIAAAKGLPYQTLISSLLHRYSAGEFEAEL